MNKPLGILWNVLVCAILWIAAGNNHDLRVTIPLSVDHSDHGVISKFQKNEPLALFESSVDILSMSSDQTDQTTMDTYVPCNQVRELSLRSSDIRYFNFARSLMIRFQSTDIIFPFHNFF
ncbi:hypothetical protein [Robertkochia solimangrovi]|uniref:hypothetical protein n=1 Tax=Robertkochia solimangrovi TaxID=2213046 RepID=UPI00117CE101|nr:hypothetical protein [Robertkochia solimangrovi]TRZ42259.1 hypothetical protein DMZ48_14620 [Robertkochia solimangrovi]